MNMSHQTLIDERVRECTGNLQNKQTLRKVLTGLFEKAEVNNWASNKLEDEWGFVANNGPYDDNYPNDFNN